MNVVFIMTDTQNKSMVGAYGHTHMATPNLDRLAAEGIRFERAYTTCPLCTPARGAIFTGQHPQVNGAWCNNVAPGRQVPIMGEIFRHAGYRAGYTGKWHLDGTAYFGDGEPGGGFEPDWWYDGKRYAEEIGPAMFERYLHCRTPDELRQAGFTEEACWGHKVADRAIDFMERVGDEPFVLAVSFDEPHGPCVAPPEYWERFADKGLPVTPNYGVPPAEPELLRIQSDQNGPAPACAGGFLRRPPFFGCNSFVDHEIGRVIDAVDRLHADDTLVIYTSDHGDQMNSHNLRGKGPMMFEETCNIPFIVRGPGLPAGAVSEAVVSHVDILPTMLEWTGQECPPLLHGVSLLPALREPGASVRDRALVGFTRFAINHDSFGEFYPVRCVTDGRYKLVVNLFESDQLYDLQTDPCELDNRLLDPALATVRDALHDWLLAEMDRTRDPFRTYRWGHRTWRQVRQEAYWRGERREAPRGFPFQPSSISAE